MILGYVRQITRFKSKEEYLAKVQYELALTLNSRVEPYTSADELGAQFAQDSGLSPIEVAFDFKYPNFQLFLHSDLMKDHVRIVPNGPGSVLYLPHIDERSKHIRDNQAISHCVVIEKEKSTESRKVAKAMLPENRACLMEGKRRFVDLAYHLGGEEKPVSYQALQDLYMERFNVNLSSAELKRLFQRDKISKILMTLMHEEFELFRADERPGQIFMKLRVSRDDLFARFEEFEKEQENFLNRPKDNVYMQQDRRRRGPKKAPLDPSSLRQVLPPITAGDDDFNEESVFGKNAVGKGTMADKFQVSPSAGSKNGNKTGSQFDTLWKRAENFTFRKKLDNSEGDSSDEGPPVREFGKNVPRLVDKSKPVQWTKRAQDGVFTSDEEDNEDEEEEKKSHSNNVSNASPRVSPKLAQTAQPASVPASHEKVPSPPKIQQKTPPKFMTESDDENRNIQAKSRMNEKKSAGKEKYPVFSDSSEGSFVYDDDATQPTTSKNASAQAGDIIYPQATRGTLSKPLTITSKIPNSLDSNEDDGISSPYSMVDADVNGYFGGGKSASTTTSKRPMIGSYSTNAGMRQRESITTGVGDFTSSAYSTVGSVMSSLSRSITAGRSGYGRETQMAMTSFEFLKHKQSSGERTQYLGLFISSVILYRSPEALEYQNLVDILEKLDPNYELILDGMSLVEFVEIHCASVAVLVHRDSVVFGWHPSKKDLSTIMSSNSDVATLRARSRQ